MADGSLPKRHREEVETSLGEQEDFENSVKRQNPYNQILSILDEEDDELNQDYLTDIFTTLHQELSSSSENSINFENNLIPSNNVLENEQVGSFSFACSQSSKDENEEDCNNVMRHLLEASDDELGLPKNIGDGGSEDGVTRDGDVYFPLNDELWEIEDEAANYYAILQSELFM